jgi:Ser/Thr protein kinase RdoA (MazF antagonist)
MIKFDKPAKLNGSELLDELNAGGVVITTPPLIDGNGNFWLEIAEKDTAKTAAILAAHNGTTVAPDNTAAKTALLAKLGITDDEAKLLLS